MQKNTGANSHGLRNYAHQEMRAERIENAVHFGIPRDDVTMTQKTCVQAEVQTDSTEVQADSG